MAVRLIAAAVLAASASPILSMCATSPAPVEETEVYQTGPDGLPIRHAPTDTVESSTLPEPAAAEQAASVEAEAG